MDTHRTPAESAVTMTQLVLPSHTNNLGSAFGGTIMAWIDVAAAVAASRHARGTVVTASVDALNFHAPVKAGSVVILKASVNYAGRSSMEVGVRVEVEDVRTGQTHHTVSAYLTFVALDDDGKPRAIPRIEPQTDSERRRWRAAQRRRASRLEHRERERLAEAAPPSPASEMPDVPH